MTQANIYHLYHSGVAVETTNSFLVFDYYNDTPAKRERSLSNGVLDAKEFTSDNNFVFVTHNHHDHFNPTIFDWETEREIKYLLSSDVQAKKKENRYKMDKYQKLELEDILVETYGTTDQGLSFYTEIDGLNIFHAGDLNWWHWKKFSPQECKQEEKDFKEELARLEDKEIDIAFVPVDPRLEEYYYLAGEYFIETIEPKLLVPIHFADNYQITSDFARHVSQLPTEVAEIKERGDQIEFKK
ncbi:MBL fold metallo-hydrolase [Halanaerocella petrolearia]